MGFSFQDGSVRNMVDPLVDKLFAEKYINTYFKSNHLLKQ